jgi:hypothetical protein
MNPQIALNLAMILFLPWFAILGVLFWVYPRAPRPPGRRLFDASTLALATLAGVLSTWWSMANADPTAGAIWKQVLASTLSYGAFLAVLTTAFFLRRRWLTTVADAQPELPR